MTAPSISEIQADLKRCAAGLEALNLNTTARDLRVVIGGLEVEQAKAAEEIRIMMEAAAGK